MKPASRRGWAVLAVCVVVMTLFMGLGHLPLIAPDEGRNAEVAREMKESGAWLVPTYNGVDYLDKPSFFFKTVAFSLALFGNNEAAARLPSALFALALVTILLRFCRRVYDSERVAWLAAIVVAAMPMFLAHARIVIFDMMLAFFVCGAIFAGYLAEETEGRSRRNWYLLGAVCAGFATLVKGPVGFLVPVLVLLVFNRFAGRRGVWKRLFAPLNFLVFFAITLPWFIGLCIQRPDFLHYGLVQESFNRFTDAESFDRAKPFYYYAIIVAATFMPWSLLLPQAVVAAWKQRRSLHRADLLCIVWSVLVVVFFSISQSKQPGYVLSVSVPTGVLVARLLDAALTRARGGSANALRLGTIIFTVVCLLATGVSVWGLTNPERFIEVAKIDLEDPLQFRADAWPLAVCFAGLAVLGAVAIIRRSVTVCVVCLSLACPLFLLASVRGVDDVMSHRSGRALAATLRGLPPETEIVTLNCYPNGVPFYLQRTMTLVTEDGDELTSNYVLSMLRKPGPWPENIVPAAQFDEWLAGRTDTVFLITRNRERSRLESLASERGVEVRQLNKRFVGALLPPKP